MTPEKERERYEICKACDDFISLTKQCKLCMCIMPLKVKWSGATCPAGKWGAEECP